MKTNTLIGALCLLGLLFGKSVFGIGFLSNPKETITIDTVYLMELVENGNKLVSAYPDSALNIAKYLELSNDSLTQLGKGSTMLSADIYELKGKSYRRQGKIDDAIFWFDSASVIYNKLNDVKKLSAVFHGMGNVYFVSGNLKSAVGYYTKAIRIREENRMDEDLAKTCANMGSVYFRLGAYDSAFYYQNKSLDLRMAAQDSNGVALCYNNLGNIYLFQGEYGTALNYYDQALFYLDTTKSSRREATIVNNIGNIYQRRGVYDKALYYYRKALDLYTEFEDKRGSGNVYINLGHIYSELNEMDSTEVYYKRALMLFVEIDDKLGEADAYHNMAESYYIRGLNTAAQSFAFKAIEIEEEVGDENGVANGYLMLGKCNVEIKENAEAIKYFNLALEKYRHVENTMGEVQTLIEAGKHYIDVHEYQKAIDVGKKAEKLARIDGLLKEQRNAHLIIGDAYKAQNKYRLAVISNEKVMALNDSIMNAEKAEAILNLEMKYENQQIKDQMAQRQQLLNQRNKEIAATEKAYELERRLRMIYLVTAFILLLMLVYLIYLVQQKKQTNQLLKLQKSDMAEKNEELNQLNEELLSQRSFIESQHKDISEQKEKVDQLYKNLTDSIVYAEYIQQALLPDEELAAIFPEHFVLNLPKDVVSGDFYWATKIGDENIVAVGDCTGHGVPGGFMSVLGITLLKEVVNAHKITDPASILTHLRTRLIDSLHQNEDINDHVDGIDLAIVNVNEKTKEVVFSGAKGNLVVAGKAETTLVKGDIASLGYYKSLKPYTNKKLNVVNGDYLYFYTDGFIDQFSESNKRFGKNRFVELCKENVSVSLKVQKELYYGSFVHWKGKAEQIDDTLVLGVRLNIKDEK